MTNLTGATKAESRFAGQVASSGFAAGPLFRFSERAPSRIEANGSPGEQLSRFDDAISAAIEELNGLTAILADDDAKALVEFQIAMLEDETVTDPVKAAINAGEDALSAWGGVLDAMISDYHTADDAYFRGRALDLADMRDRVLRGVAGLAERKIPGGRIVVADDLSPTRFLTTDWTDGGIALTAGSTNSHVAMLARARAVPMLVGVQCSGESLEGHALLDGERGTLIVKPSPQSRTEFRARRDAADEIARAEAVFLDKPAATAGGERVSVCLNIAGPDDLQGLNPRHCDGIGLVRTELLLSGAAVRHEETQFANYRRILEWAGGKSVTIRTLDAGGDKPIPGVTLDGEANPFLGVRGVRLSLLHKDVFKIQLRALLRASVYGSLKIMVPMIGVPDEMIAARKLLDEAQAELAGKGIATGAYALGMMVEVPAAAIAIEDFDAEFYSIGSNDLIQYVMAAARDSARLANLSDGVPRAVRSLMARVAEHGRSVNREASICGDIAGDPACIPLLLDCGIRTLSVAPAALARTKAAIARYGAVHA